LALIVVLGLALAALVLVTHRHRSHASQSQTRMALRQEAYFADRKTPIRILIASRWSNTFDRSNMAGSNKFGPFKGRLAHENLH
jgi:hypothetical protein